MGNLLQRMCLASQVSGTASRLEAWQQRYVPDVLVLYPSTGCCFYLALTSRFRKEGCDPDP